MVLGNALQAFHFFVTGIVVTARVFGFFSFTRRLHAFSIYDKVTRIVNILICLLRFAMDAGGERVIHLIASYDLERLGYCLLPRS